MNRSFPFFACILMSPVLMAQVTTENALSPEEYVQQVLVGEGVQVFNVTYNGQANVPGGQPGIGSFNANSTILQLSSGLVLATCGISNVPAGGTFQAGSGAGGDQDLSILSGAPINELYDKSVLEFDFIPTGDTISFNFVFASREYTSFTCSGFNDAFGFFLSGPGITGPFTNNAKNIALVPNTNVPITINSVNSGTPSGSYPASNCAAVDPNWQDNSVYFIPNSGSSDINFNGLTVPLTAWSLVTCGETYHIKLAIADAQDGGFDSAVFLEGGSFTSAGQVIPELTGGVGIDGNNMTEGCGPFELVFTRLGDTTDEITVELVAGGSAVPTVDYEPALPTELNFPSGVEQISIWLDVPVNGGGPETIEITILQLIACAGQAIETSFTFNILAPEPLTVDFSTSTATAVKHTCWTRR